MTGLPGVVPDRGQGGPTGRGIGGAAIGSCRFGGGEEGDTSLEMANAAFRYSPGAVYC
jgi:hypothetical protein